MAKTIWKAVAATIFTAVIIESIYSRVGYERTELLAFSVLIGLTIAEMKKSH